jgi:hypothetical protein
MSRLDSILRRLAAQRDGLVWAIAHLGPIEGAVLDMGLGNGRTYDHLREHITDRRILVIDRVLQCHKSCIPPAADFLQGEAVPMLQQLARTGPKIALAHYDFGGGDKEMDVADAALHSPWVADVMAPGGLIVSGQPLVGFESLAGPKTIAPDRYQFYRAAG